MKILTIDTTTSGSRVGLVEDNTLLLEKGGNDNHSHSEKLFQLIGELFTETGWSFQDLDAVAVTHGPGSFTGLRIGIAAAKGIAFALSLPLAGVSSLEALACNWENSSDTVIPLMDAKRGEIYGRLFHEESVFPPHVWKEKIEKLEGKKILLGDGALVYTDFFQTECREVTIPSGDYHVPQASSIARLALRQFQKGEIKEILPHYLRVSDAEIGLQKKKKLGMDFSRR